MNHDDPVAGFLGKTQAALALASLQVAAVQDQGNPFPADLLQDLDPYNPSEDLARPKSRTGRGFIVL